MWKKFTKNRSVHPHWNMIPLKYTGIKHPTNSHKELVLIDDFGKHYSAAWRNDKTCKIGITFLLKKVRTKKRFGFIFKDKFYGHTKYGWVR